jgi:DNA topoisomerase-1
MPTRTAEPAQTAAQPPSRTARDGLTIRRRRCGTGFSYYGKDGRRIADPGVIRRLAGLAVPPAYADVVYAEDESAPLQAMGRDAAGRWQYRYHSDWEKVRERRKTRHLVRLIGALPRIRRHVTSVLSTRQPTREFAMAAVIALIDATGIRAGTSRHARLSGARGAVTLLKSNVQLNGRTVTLAFKAKGGKQVVKEVQEPRLLPAIKLLQRLPGGRLFLYRDQAGQVRAIRTREVNAFLCDVAGCKVSLKDFRMFRACVNVVETLARTEPGESQARRKRQVKQAIQTAAEDLANTVSICRKSYVHEAVIEAFEQGKLNGKAKTPNGRPAPPQRVLAEVVAAHVPG